MTKKHLGTILLIEDNSINRDMLTALLQELEYQVFSAENGLIGIEKTKQIHPDLILMDIEMPIMNGMEACAQIKSIPEISDIPIIFLTGLAGEKRLEKAFELGAVDFLVKPVRMVELKARVSTHISHYHLLSDLEQLVVEKTQEINDLRETALRVVATLAETRDPETGAHIKRVQHYSRLLANELLAQGIYADIITPKFVESIYYSSPLHDIGKVGIPDAILLKPGKLTAEEFEIMRTHASLGYEALSATKGENVVDYFLDMAADIALYHHARFDGNGYPTKAKGQEIPIAGRIVALVDVYDALTSARCYKPMFSHEQAKEIMVEEMNGAFDPKIFEIFLYLEDKFIDIHDKFLD